MNEQGENAYQRALKAFNEGANCPEAMWQAFYHGLDKDQQGLGNCLAGGFGGGACAKDLCGAIAGGIIVLGLHYGRIPSEPRNPKLKEICNRFYNMAQEELGSVYCRDLRDPEDDNYREKCSIIVAKMAEFIEGLLEEDGCTNHDDCNGNGASGG